MAVELGVVRTRAIRPAARRAHCNQLLQLAGVVVGRHRLAADAQ